MDDFVIWTWSTLASPISNREERKSAADLDTKWNSKIQSKAKQNREMIRNKNDLRAIRNWDEWEEQGLKKKVPAATVAAGTFFQ